MMGMGDGSCPFEFNFEPATFKVGDIVSYRVGGSLEGMPFVGVLTAVGDCYVEIKNGEDVNSTERAMRGTREDRPFVTEEEALREETVG